jgi:hypothetical protein
MCRLLLDEHLTGILKGEPVTQHQSKILNMRCRPLRDFLKDAIKVNTE